MSKHNHADKFDHPRKLFLLAREDPAKFDEFFDLFDEKMRSFANQITRGDRSATEDLLQETRIRLYRTARRYRSEAALTSWVYRLMHNLYIDMKKKEKRTEELDETNTVHFDEHVLDRIEREETTAQLHRLIPLLSPKYQRVLNAYQSGMKYEEIARKFDIPIGTVKSTLGRSYEGLRRMLAFTLGKNILQAALLKHGTYDRIPQHVKTHFERKGDAYRLVRPSSTNGSKQQLATLIEITEAYAPEIKQLQPPPAHQEYERMEDHYRRFPLDQTHLEEPAARKRVVHALVRLIGKAPPEYQREDFIRHGLGEALKEHWQDNPRQALEEAGYRTRVPRITNRARQITTRNA